VSVLSRKDWVLSETGVTPPILPGNLPSCILIKYYLPHLCAVVFLDRLYPKILKRN
jgi:hypothetical protein